jgi:trigger factor
MVEFELIVPWNQWEKYLDITAAEASQEIKIEGFRPGKAPRKLVEQKIGKNTILYNAGEKAARKSYADFVTREKIEVLGRPDMEIIDIEEGKDMRCKVKVAVVPEVKIDEKYVKGIKNINQEYSQKETTVDEKEVDLEIEKLANNRVKLVTVRRETQKDDNVEIDFEVLMGNVPIEGGISKKHNLIIGRGVFIPGFEEQLIGMKEGEEKEFELNFPENYHQKNLAGKPATFRVKLNLVQERQTPEINDEFAVSLGKFKNLEELKNSVREGLEHENKHKREEEKKTRYLEEISKSTDVDLPDVMVDEDLRNMIDDLDQQAQAMGLNLETYLVRIGKTKEDLEKEWRPQAEKRVVSAMVLKEIAKLENIVAEAPEVEAEMNKVMAYYKNVKDIEKNIDMERLYNYCKGIVENEKVFEFLEKI